MIDDHIGAAIAAADARGTGGGKVYIHERLTDIDAVPETLPEPPAPKPPTAQPTPTATVHPDARPAPHGAGTAPPDSTIGFDIARIVDRIQSGEPSMTGYREQPAIVRHR